MSKLLVELEIPQDCLNCPFCHENYYEDAWGEEGAFFDGYFCSLDCNHTVHQSSEMLRYRNKVCPFAGYLPVIERPATDKQKAFIKKIEEAGFPKCEDFTRQGAFLYIQKYADDYKIKMEEKRMSAYYTMLRENDEEQYELGELLLGEEPF